MKELVQSYKTGEVLIRETPIPVVDRNFVLVRNHYSVISSGTERFSLSIGKSSLLGKAMARPDLVRKVVQKAKEDGIMKTLQMVNTRLERPVPIGYSCAGDVIEVGSHVVGIQAGDRVACGGVNYASHAEFVSVPGNIMVRVPDQVSLEEAAFTTIGAIALQGLRVANPILGERFLVIGLGLLGQIAVQLLLANGCHVIGFDTAREMTERAVHLGATGIYPEDDVIKACDAFSMGRGLDGVLIYAGTTSNRPIEIAGEVTREKGRVVVVGAVGMEVPREPYYQKEIQITISRSYGPGRYDPVYEERGQDYPFGYVRFTERRNMEAFLELVAKKKVDVKGMITHQFEFEDAIRAYKIILGEGNEEEGEKKPHLGVVLKYDFESSHPRNTVVQEVFPVFSGALGTVRVSLIGAGNYATASLLPLLKKHPHVVLQGILTLSGRTAQTVAERFGFHTCPSSVKELMGGDTDLAMILTRHDSHFSLTAEAVRSGKHVYVEKPLVIREEDLKIIYSIHRKFPERQIIVGFNRRFSHLTREVIRFLAPIKTPRMINIRVNAGTIPRDHWIQNPDVGGGRLVGEVCHFVDLAQTLAGSYPVSVFARGVSHPNVSALLNDNVFLQISFADGSLASILYTSHGSTWLAKEYIEVFGGGRSAIIDDFKTAFLYDGSSALKKIKLRRQDKGQETMIREMIASLKEQKALEPFEKSVLSTLTIFRAIESMSSGTAKVVSLADLERE